MADKISKNVERPAERMGSARKEKVSHGEREIKETSKELIEGVSEVVEGAESAEFAEGEVAERTGEGKKKAPAGGIKAGAAAAVATAKTMPPTIEIMRIQVAIQVEKEVRLLERQAAAMLRSPGNFNPFKLNGIVAKIRELKDILANLAYATAETLKSWWMKYVKGSTV